VFSASSECPFEGIPPDPGLPGAPGQPGPAGSGGNGGSVALLIKR
jgi:hypothetical protein